MKRLGSLGAVLPLLALGAGGCGANNTPGAELQFKHFDIVADFETSAAFIPGPMVNGHPLWSGGFTGDHDMSTTGTLIVALPEALTPPRIKPDGSMSTGAFHIADNGKFTNWGSVLYGDLQSSKKAVNLSQYTGISLWVRSAGMAGFTVKVAISDYGSFDQVNIAEHPQLCDIMDTTVGGRGCYDDYAAKIYPDAVWRRYDIPFSSLATGGWGLLHTFDPTMLYRIKISMLPTTAYDLYFDDIVFYTD